MWPKMKMLCAPEGAEGNQPGTTVPPANTTTATPPAATTATDPPADAGEVTTKGGKVLPMSRSTIDGLKRENQEKGRKSAAREYDQRAKDLGYESFDDMAKKIERDRKAREEQKKRAKANANGQQRTENAGNGQRRDDNQPRNGTNGNGAATKNDREQRLSDDRFQKERRERIRAQNRARRMEQERLAVEGAKELEIEALKSGITDPEYAVTLFTRECQSKQATLSADDYGKWLDEVSERKYFEGLRATRPHLFQEPTRPATTGTETPPSPPPGAAQVTRTLADASKTNARGMSRQEYQDELKRRGLRIPTT